MMQQKDNAITPNKPKRLHAQQYMYLPTWLSDVPTAHRTASASMPGARRCCPAAAPAVALASPARTAAAAAAAASTFSLSPSKTSAMPARMRIRSSTVTTSDTATICALLPPPLPPLLEEALAAAAKDGCTPPLVPSDLDPRSIRDGRRQSWYTRGGRQSSCC